MRGLDETAYAEITTDLSERFADTVTPADAADAVAQARAELEPQSRHPEFLGLLVAKRATDLLREHISSRGERLHAVPTVLFMCEHGAARSQMAAAVAHEFGGDHLHVRATGRQQAAALDPTAAAVLHERGIDLDRLISAGPLADVVHAPDVLVVMGTDPADTLAHRRVDWEVPDPHGRPIEEVRAIADEIEDRVRGLLGDLSIPVAPARAGAAGATGTPALTG